METSKKETVETITRLEEAIKEQIIPESLAADLKAVIIFTRDRIHLVPVYDFPSGNDDLGIRFRNILYDNLIYSFHQLLSLNSQELFKIFRKRRLFYRGFIKNLNEMRIAHNFEAEPWNIK